MTPEEERFKELERKINRLEQHVINLIIPVQSIAWIAGKLEKPLDINDSELLNLLDDFKTSVSSLINTIQTTDFAKIAADLTPSIESIKNIDKTLGEIKFIGKRVHEIDRKLDKFGREGIDQKVVLDFKVDGYNLVKKPISYDATEPIEDAYEGISKVLDILANDREKKALILRLGLMGERPHKFADIGKKFGVTAARGREIYRKALWRLINKLNKETMAKIKDTPLGKALSVIGR